MIIQLSRRTMRESLLLYWTWTFHACLRGFDILNLRWLVFEQLSVKVPVLWFWEQLWYTIGVVASRSTLFRRCIKRNFWFSTRRHKFRNKAWQLFNKKRSLRLLKHCRSMAAETTIMSTHLSKQLVSSTVYALWIWCLILSGGDKPRFYPNNWSQTGASDFF